jgi:hypothetical protein
VASAAGLCVPEDMVSIVRSFGLPNPSLRHPVHQVTAQADPWPSSSSGWRNRSHHKHEQSAPSCLFLIEGSSAHASCLFCPVSMNATVSRTAGVYKESTLLADRLVMESSPIPLRASHAVNMFPCTDKGDLEQGSHPIHTSRRHEMYANISIVIPQCSSSSFRSLRSHPTTLYRDASGSKGKAKECLLVKREEEKQQRKVE